MLFLIYPLRYGDTLVQVVSESGTRSNLVAGNRPVPDNDGSLICYMTYKAFKFARGDEIPITSGGRLGFCPSGDYFFHYDSTRRGAVLRTRWPDVPLFELPTNFWPHNIFVRTNDIYVFGHKDPPGPNRLGPAWGLVYASKDGFHLEKEIDLSAFQRVF
jgi:hypothetical protein